MLWVNRYNQFHLGDKRGDTGESLALPNSPDSHFLTFLDPMHPLAIPDCFPAPTTGNLSSVSNLHTVQFNTSLWLPNLFSEITLFSLPFQWYFSHLGNTTATSYEFSFSELKISNFSLIFPHFIALYIPVLFWTLLIMYLLYIRIAWIRKKSIIPFPVLLTY